MHRYYPTNCPAIIFNESGSMAVMGRLETSMDIIKDIIGKGPADYYINSSYTGLPRLIAHLPQLWSREAAARMGNRPLIPMPTGDDYMIIDDGDGCVKWVSTALHTLKNMKSSGYMHPVTVYFLRSKTNNRMAQRYYDELKQDCPAEEGFNILFYYVPDDDDGLRSRNIKLESE
jgi:hypothetical protein